MLYAGNANRRCLSISGGVFNNTGIVGESSLGMFVETWINISTLLPCT